MSENRTENSRKRIREIFFEVYKKKTPLERSQYLDQVCGADSGLRKELESLLEAHDRSGSLLEVPPLASDVVLDNSPISESPGTTIDRYKLLEKIGEGGMAIVYMAEQEKPIRRKVALKIIKLGMDTRQVIARFEVERQALAMMDHPNIAKVLDAGATETGRPYFVMELVTGVAITEYCDKNNLSTNERLDLFIQVCNAVQHAHQKGIIHRDIKPTNVMVTHHDGKPVPKVIDFGIAKAINQRLTEKTLFTRYAHIIGTPAYMSPEQAELSDVDVDTRTDIYSLGVLLYELLTGTTPFGEEELRKAGYIEMQRIIRESEPLKPSTKLSTMGDALAGVAEHRKTKPDLLAKLVRGDLDWIVMKSLEKDRARRYEAADRLALDIQRHLEHRPVLAHAPSTSYRLHKFLRRHRWQAIAALAMVVVAGTITILSIRNRYQVRLAEAEGARQVSALSEARKTLRPLLESEHAGLEARILFAGVIVGGNAPDEVLKGTEAIMERHYRKRVQFYSEKIQANPADANNYLQRAQQYHYLHEEQNVHSDMVKYAAILCGGRSSDLRFGTPVNLGSVVNGPSSSEQISCISHDGLEMYISWGTPEVDWEICVSRRATTHSDWGPPENLGPVVNTQYEESCACMSADGLTLYFNSNRPGGYGGFDIYMTTRATQNDTWGAPVNVGPGVNGYASDAAPWITTDGLELYFTSSRPGGYGRADIYVTKRATESDPWGEPVNLGPVVNSEYHDYFPSLSPDGLLLFFSDNIEGLPRPGGFGDSDLWVSMRPTTQDSWGAPVDLGPQVNGPYTEHGPRVSPDGLTLYFSSRVRPGGYGRWDIWQAPILPVGDFNTDGIVK